MAQRTTIECPHCHKPLDVSLETAVVETGVLVGQGARALGLFVGGVLLMFMLVALIAPTTHALFVKNHQVKPRGSYAHFPISFTHRATYEREYRPLYSLKAADVHSQARRIEVLWSRNLLFENLIHPFTSGRIGPSYVAITYADGREIYRDCSQSTGWKWAHDADSVLVDSGCLFLAELPPEIERAFKKGRELISS